MKLWTKILLSVTAITWIAYDVVAYVEPSEGDTISEVTLDTAAKWPALAWAFGALAGHLFWPSKRGRPTWLKFTGLGALFGMLGAILALSKHFAHVPLPIMLGAGILSGALIWPQTKRKSPPS